MVEPYGESPGGDRPLGGGVVQVLIAFMLGLHLQDRHISLDLDDLRRAMWESPTAYILILLFMTLMWAMVRLAHDASGLTRLLLGLIHSTLQLAGLAAVMIVASRLSSANGLRGAWSFVVFLAVVALLGGIGGMVGMSGYLWVATSLGFHGNEGYAPLHHEHLKHFLRLHINVDGTLTLYPIDIDRVGRKWELRPDAAAHEPWFEPSGPEPEPHLIEQPVKIGRTDPSAARSRRSTPSS